MKDDNIKDTTELFESAFYTQPTYNSETGNVERHTPLAPSFENIWKLKRRHPDYRHGPVKEYTKQEIEEYERDH
jgi:hypothetical protein